MKSPIFLCLAFVALLEPFCKGRDAAAASARSVSQSPSEEAVTVCDLRLKRTRTAVREDAAHADIHVVALMREEEACAARVAKAGLRALPRKDGRPDVRMLAAMTKAALHLIYTEFPACRGEVREIVLTAVECLRGVRRSVAPKDSKEVVDGKDFAAGKNVVPLEDAGEEPDGSGLNQRDLEQLLGMILPEMFLYDGNSISSLMDALGNALEGSFPGVLPTLNALREGVTGGSTSHTGGPPVLPDVTVPGDLPPITP